MSTTDNALLATCRGLQADLAQVEKQLATERDYSARLEHELSTNGNGRLIVRGSNRPKITQRRQAIAELDQRTARAKAERERDHARWELGETRKQLAASQQLVDELRQRLVAAGPGAPAAAAATAAPKRKPATGTPTRWQQIVAHLRRAGEATAGELADAIGMQRNHVSVLIAKHSDEIGRRRIGRQVKLWLKGEAA